MKLKSIKPIFETVATVINGKVVVLAQQELKKTNIMGNRL